MPICINSVASKEGVIEVSANMAAALVLFKKQEGIDPYPTLLYSIILSCIISGFILGLVSKPKKGKAAHTRSKFACTPVAHETKVL
jgi:hypothetical protein